MRIKAFLLLTSLILTPYSGHAAKLPVVALFYNPTTNTTTASNRVEGQLKCGLEEGVQAVPKRRVQFQWIHAGETSEETLNAFDKIKSMKPDLIIGPSLSSQVLILLKLLEQNQMTTPLVTPTATSTEILAYNNVLMVANSNSVQARMLVSVIKERKPKQVMIIDVRDCVYCTNMAGELSAALAAAGVEYLSRTVMERDIETSEILAAATGTDHIVVPGLEVSTAKIIRRMFVNNSQAQFWSGDGVGSLARFVRDLNLSGLKFSWMPHYSAQIKNPQNIRFVDLINKKYQLEPVDTAAFAFEGVRLGLDRYIRKIPTTKFASLTGAAELLKKQVRRPMPLMELKNNKPNLVRVVDFRGGPL